MPQRTILAADDIENATESGKWRSRAIGRAASSLAQRLKTGVEILYVEDLKSHPPSKFDATRIGAWHSRHHEKLEEMSKCFSVPVCCSLKCGSPAEEILKIVRMRSAPELVILGTHGEKGVKRLFVGSVAEEVIRNSRRPVMVLGPAAVERDQNMTGRKPLIILLATDLGRNSRAAEQYALSLARRISARIVLYHCLWDSYQGILLDTSMVAGWVPVNLDEILSQKRKNSADALERKVRFFRTRGVPCDYRIEEKALPSANAVYRESCKGYAMVVMGTHGRNVVLSAFFGSTARETILHAPIPVIIVHSGHI